MPLRSSTKIKPIESSWIYYQSPQSDLLYFVHYKCASTLYRRWFEKIGWQQVELTPSEIDWDNSYVFSYIKDPLIKHRKGLVEFFSAQPYHDMTELALKNDSRWLSIIAGITALDGHSRTIRSILGEQIPLKIDWIPIDIDFDHKKYTLDMLEAKGEIIDKKNKQELIAYGKIYEATEEKKRLFDRLIEISPSPIISDYIDYDRCLYTNIVYSILERQ